MTRVGNQLERDRLVADLTLAAISQVVLHVAGAAGRVGLVVLAEEFLEQPIVGLAHDMGQHVEPSTVRHADHDIARAQPRGMRDGLVHHRHQRIHAFDREPLHVHEREAQEALESVDVCQPAQQRALLLRAQQRGESPRLDRLAEPLALLLFVQVVVFESDVATPELAHPRDHVGRGPARASERGRGQLSQISFGDAVKLGRHLRRAERRRSQRVDLDAEVSVALDRAHEAGGAGDLAKELCVSGRGRRCRASQLFREPEILPPAFVY